jgi:hypothetical protein
MAQLSFDGPCAPVTGAAAAGGSTTTGASGRESTMNLSPRSQARTLASGPLALLDVLCILTTFRLKRFRRRGRSCREDRRAVSGRAVLYAKCFAAVKITFVKDTLVLRP